jgi:hypothetical protein
MRQFCQDPLSGGTRHSDLLAPQGIGRDGEFKDETCCKSWVVIGAAKVATRGHEAEVRETLHSSARER